MFKTLCLILVFYSIKTYSLKCYKCKEEKPEATDERSIIDDYKGGDCKDKNYKGNLTECSKDKTLPRLNCTGFLKYSFGHLFQTEIKIDFKTN